MAHTLSIIPSVFSRFASSLLLITLLCTGCSRSSTENTQTPQVEINVAAASNLTNAFTELGKEFTSRSGIRVTYSFGATADLTRQIENNAPYDVFAAADVEHVERLESKGLLTGGTRKIYARGRLVLWTPPDSRIALTRLEDLSRPEVERIAIAKPDVAPYGRATIEALRALGLWPQLEPKVVYGQNVSQVKQYAATGNVDAAFIPLALVVAGEGRVTEVDERLHQSINQAIGVVKESQKQEAARRFVEFVTGEEGQALLERYGYRRP